MIATLATWQNWCTSSNFTSTAQEGNSNYLSCPLGGGIFYFNRILTWARALRHVKSPWRRAEWKRRRNRLSSCHLPGPYSSCTALLVLGLYTMRMPEFFLKFFYTIIPSGYPMGITMQKKVAWAFWKVRQAFLHWAFHSSKCPPTHDRLSLLLSIEYCRRFWLLLLVLATVVGFGYCCWFWLLLSNFWPNPKVNSWVLLTFTDNFTIIDNMNRTTSLWKL
jgi:hypothetical protein